MFPGWFLPFGLSIDILHAFLIRPVHSLLILRPVRRHFLFNVMEFRTVQFS